MLDGRRREGFWYHPPKKIPVRGDRRTRPNATATCPTSQPCTVWTQATNSLLMKRKLLDRPKPKQAGYLWRLFIPMKTQ